MNAIRRCLSVTALCFATMAHAQPLEVTGEVSQVFGDRFVLQTGSGDLLVTAPPGAPQVQAGQRLTVTGERNGDQMLAEHIQTDGASQQETGAATASDAELPAALRGLGLEIVGSRDWPYGKREFLTRLADGTRIEIEVDRDGHVREIEAEGRRAVMPTTFLERVMPDSIARHPQLQNLSGLRKIEISDDGEVEIEGFSASGGEIEAEFDRLGRLVDFDLD
ncbi:hypothetical protein [Mesorhizobium xinjiangense]|uniref:hypothetical protein n=1 Tax=Mesorhizobium xinjiangense TaxID=2678685 RepID=UPI0012EE0CA1|nr:hypothetical protein [Mesorhizobium xinjiangense]